MRFPRHCSRRTGLTLLEVVVSVAVFLMGIVAIGHLISMGSEYAGELTLETEGIQLCQSKLHEAIVGAIPLTAQTEQPFEHNDKWYWSMDCEEGVVTGLWTVVVTVKRTRANGIPIQLSMTQMVLDPSLRGFTTQPSADESAAATDTDTGTTTDTGGTTGGTTGTTGGGTTGGGSPSPIP